METQLKKQRNETAKNQYNGLYNGLYSYFIRGVNRNVTQEVIDEIKQHAIKVVETKRSILIVGRNWVVVGKKACDTEYERIEVRCLGDVCVPYGEIASRDIEHIDGVIENVEVNCNEQEIEIHDIAYYMCRIGYRYCSYYIIIAVKIDPHDIHILKNDKELQLLLDLIPIETLLVRPM